MENMNEENIDVIKYSFVTETILVKKNKQTYI